MKLTKYVFCICAIALCVFALAGCSSTKFSDQTREKNELARLRATKKYVEKKITVGDNYFSPKKTTVKAGTIVIWTNKGTAIHDVMQDDPLDESKPHIPEAMKDFSSDVLRSGDIHVVLFSEPGTYYYHCHFHGGPQRGQWGVITVKD